MGVNTLPKTTMVSDFRIEFTGHAYSDGVLSFQDHEACTSHPCTFSCEASCEWTYFPFEGTVHFSGCRGIGYGI